MRRAEAVLAANIVPDEAVRPLMGWSSWNCFALEINEEKIVSQAVAMASNGLKAAGFLYINTDCDLHFRQLGFDYIKVDYCGGSKLKLNEQARYTEISKAIRATGRDVKFNICRWAYPGTWVADIADSWRVTGDIRASWKSVRQIFLIGLPLSAYASRGHYNDLDMLEIGHASDWKPTFDGDMGLTANEEVAHFGLWCIQSSPLVLGCDLRTMPQAALDLVTNPYLLAMNANDLGLQAYPVRREGEVVTLVKDAGERYGLSRYVAVVNLGDVEAKADLKLEDVDLGGRAYAVDLVEKAEVGSFEKLMSLTLKPHSAKFYRLFADRRLVRRVYRADCAWLRRYHKLNWSDDAPMYQVVQPGPGEDGDSVDAVFGLGRYADNDLQWKDVRVFEPGTYELTFTVLTDAPRGFSVSVDGQPSVELKVPAKRWTQKVSCRMPFAAGVHAVRIFNEVAPAPAIVVLRLTRVEEG